MEEIPMNKIKHAAAKKVFAGVMDYAVDQVNKNPETAYEKIIDTAEKYLKDFGKGVNWDYLRKVACNPEYTLNRYITSMVQELHPNVLKTTLMNLGFEAFYNGTKTIHEMREIHKCNIPWIILMDPTSACNLHCTGCWAAEYGNKLNLTFEELDDVVRQGKQLGVFLFHRVLRVISSRTARTLARPAYCPLTPFPLQGNRHLCFLPCQAHPVSL